VDFDIVEDSNLQRQVLFTTRDIGRPKVEAAAERLKLLNPYIKIETYNTRIDSSNAMDIIQKYDVVADGTDNFPTRYLVNDACVLLGKTNVYASIFRFEGQVSVFNHLMEDGTRGPNYRDLFPAPPPPGLVPSCAEGGVIGVLPGILGSLQASEVIKVISGHGEPLSGRFFLFDAATFETRTLKIHKDPDNPISGTNPTLKELIDYEVFCGLKGHIHIDEQITEDVKSLTVAELDRLIKSNEEIQVIDVREHFEYEIVNINAELMPQGDIEKYVPAIDKHKQVVVHCRSGKRSADVIRLLQDKYGFRNLYNLEGGIIAWAKEIDTSLAIY
jgi:adenylyltransferase/sulfurtransferase